MNKFIEFENTSFYTQFASVLDVIPELIMHDEYEYYMETITFLRSLFGCEYTPSNEQINMYTEENENIPEECMDDFRMLINRVFTKYTSIRKILSKMNIKNVLKDRINNQKQQHAIERQRLKMEEKEIQRKMKDEQRKQLYMYNHAIITCECGMEYTRYSHVNHYKSVEHRYRLDGITWYKNTTQNCK